MKIWSCKIGECDADILPDGADAPMRQAVERAYRDLTGFDAAFIFSGWGAELDEPERAVIENREPSDDYHRAWLIQQAAPELFEALAGVFGLLQMVGNRSDISDELRAILVDGPAENHRITAARAALSRASGTGSPQAKSESGNVQGGSAT